MGFPMSDSRLPHPASGMSAVPDQRAELITQMATHQRGAIHCLRCLGESVNNSGYLPLNHDYLMEMVQMAANHIGAMQTTLGILYAHGHSVSEADLQEIAEEPPTVLLPNEPVSDVEGGA